MAYCSAIGAQIGRGGRVALVAQHRRPQRFGKHGIVIAAALRSALGQVHAALAVERDLGDGAVDRRVRDLHLQARVAGETAIRADADRPDLVCNRVVEAAEQDGHARYAALGLREAPGVGLLHVEGGVLDVDPSPVIGNRIQSHAGAPGRAVVEAARSPHRWRPDGGSLRCRGPTRGTAEWSLSNTMAPRPAPLLPGMVANRETAPVRPSIR